MSFVFQTRPGQHWPTLSTLWGSGSVENPAYAGGGSAFANEGNGANINNGYMDVEATSRGSAADASY